MNFISNWKEKIAQYFEVHINLVKLGVVERLSKLLSYLILVLIFLFLSVCILIFIGIGLTEFFHEVLYFSRNAAYFLTAGTYFLGLIVLYLGRKYIVRIFSGVFIRILTENDEEEEEGDEDASGKENKTGEHSN
jgi:hypothetical protein